MEKLFTTSFQTSKMVTQKYSTSFSIGVRSLDKSIRDAIYSIYGFVRFADEIVDTFHQHDKAFLLDNYEKSYYEALQYGISLNPILNSFQQTVKKYSIEDELIQSFLKSMRSDLKKEKYDNQEISEYIYGSAEVVGLMCLHVFVNGDQKTYDDLKPFAMRLGAAFQKVNFLRDLQHDTEDLKRIYFPVLKNQSLNEETKKTILEDIYQDYEQALIGIKMLPKEAKLGVYIAYLYYLELTDMIKKTNADQLMKKRISVPTIQKLVLFGKGYITNKLRVW